MLHETEAEFQPFRNPKWRANGLWNGLKTSEWLRFGTVSVWFFCQSCITGADMSKLADSDLNCCPWMMARVFLGERPLRRFRQGDLQAEFRIFFPSAATIIEHIKIFNSWAWQNLDFHVHIALESIEVDLYWEHVVVNQTVYATIKLFSCRSSPELENWLSLLCREALRHETPPGTSNTELILSQSPRNTNMMQKRDDKRILTEICNQTMHNQKLYWTSAIPLQSRWPAWMLTSEENARPWPSMAPSLLQMIPHKGMLHIWSS